MAQAKPQIGVRVDPDLRRQIQAVAAKNFDGNESLLMRRATETYLRLHRRFGPSLDVMLEGWLGPTDEKIRSALNALPEIDPGNTTCRTSGSRQPR